jgi:hypothetical protein
MQLWVVVLAIVLALLFGTILYLFNRGSWGRIPLPAKIQTPDAL